MATRGERLAFGALSTPNWTEQNEPSDGCFSVQLSIPSGVMGTFTFESHLRLWSMKHPLAALVTDTNGIQYVFAVDVKHNHFGFYHVKKDMGFRARTIDECMDQFGKNITIEAATLYCMESKQTIPSENDESSVVVVAAPSIPIPIPTEPASPKTKAVAAAEKRAQPKKVTKKRPPPPVPTTTSEEVTPVKKEIKKE